MREQLRAFLLMLQAEVVTPYPRETAPIERLPAPARPTLTLLYVARSRSAEELYREAATRFGERSFGAAALAVIAASGHGRAAIVEVDQ